MAAVVSKSEDLEAYLRWVEVNDQPSFIYRAPGTVPTSTIASSCKPAAPYMDHILESSPSILSDETAPTSTLGVAQDIDRCLSVGIDFGTTHCGVAWAIMGPRGPDVSVVSWANAPMDCIKVPIDIWYKDSMVVGWGNSSPPTDGELFTMLGLYLFSEDDLVKHQFPEVAKTQQRLSEIGKSPTDVVADYLDKIWQFSVSDIRRQSGSSTRGLNLRLMISVPGNWPLYAQRAILEAARRAVLLEHNSLEMIGDTEAVAVATFCDAHISRILQVGDTIVICNVGGAALNIASYKVQDTLPLIQVACCTETVSCPSGGVFLDTAFIAHMEGRIGKEKWQGLPMQARHRLMRLWDTSVKCQYSDTASGSEIASIPYEIVKAMRPTVLDWREMTAMAQPIDNTLQFTAEHVNGLFEPMILEVLEKLHKHIEEIEEKTGKQPRAIVLVGGVGSTQILFEALLADRERSSAEVIQSHGVKGWSSACRGAALIGLESVSQVSHVPPLITSYLARAHYGILYKERFREGQHAEIDRYYDIATQQYLAYNQMRWYVKKGQEVSRGQPVSLLWEKFQPEDHPVTVFPLRLYKCESDTPPTRRENGLIKELAKIEIPVVWENMSRIQGDGGVHFRRVQFQLDMTLPGSRKHHVMVYVNGSRVVDRLLE